MSKFQVLVTGVSRGLGEALLDLLVASGGKPIGIGRRFSERQLQMADENRCRLLSCDLGDIEALERLDLDQALGSDSRPLLLINNAASVDPIGPVRAISATDLIRAYTINVVAPAALVKMTLDVADARGVSAKVLNVTSGAAKRPLGGLGAYCSSKASIEMLLGCFEQECPNVEIAHVDPGALDTDMQAALRNSHHEMLPARDMFRRYQAEGILRSTREVARDVLMSAGAI